METFENENLLDDNQRNYQVVGKNVPRKYWIGLIIILLSNISLSIVSISIWPYLNYNNMSMFILAVSISSFHTGSTVGRKFFSYFIDKTQSYWLLLFFSLSITLVGDIMYAIYPTPAIVLISRSLVGFGTGSQVILQSLLTDSSDPILLKTRISNVSFFTSLAYICGPAVIAAISSISNTVTESITTDSLKILVWLSASFTFLSILITIIGKFIDNSISKHYKSNLNSNNINNEDIYPIINKNNIFRTQKTCIIPPKVAILIFGFVHFLIFSAGMVLETLIVPVIYDIGGKSDYNMDLTKISLFFIGLGISCSIVLILSKKISDQNLLLISSLLIMGIGYALMIVWNFSVDYKTTTLVIDPPLFKFILGCTFVAIGFPIAVTSSITLFFELFATIQSPFYSIFFQLASSGGRLLGPIFSVLIFTEVNANYSFLFALVLCLTSIFLLLILKKSIKYINSTPNPKNSPIIKMEDEDDTNQF